MNAAVLESTDTEIDRALKATQTDSWMLFPNVQFGSGDEPFFVDLRVHYMRDGDAYLVRVECDNGKGGKDLWQKCNLPSCFEDWLEQELRKEIAMNERACEIEE